MNTFYIGMYMKMYGKTNFNCTYMEYTKNYDFLFVYTCLYIACTWYKPVCTWFIHVHSLKMLNLSMLNVMSTVNSPVTPS